MSLSPAAIGDLTGLVAGFQAAWAQRFGDVSKDLVALEDVAAVLADLGVPDAALAEMLLGLLSKVVAVKAAFPASQFDGPYWYRPGPERLNN